MKPVLFSGIQPSGRLHIGNYLGALRNFIDLQNSGEYQCYFSIVDLHALTENPAPRDLSGNIAGVTADFLAAGLDPKRSVIFQQSQISAHSELAWMLNTITPMGELERMTQFKDKSLQQREIANTGLFDYPVLMAADIFLYNTAVVPVGNDQLQHLELARTLARKFNARFGKTFLEPKALLTKTPRVMSLRDPMKKMSKSQPDGCIFLDDAPEEIQAKLARATTDSGSEVAYDPEKKPGLSNLLSIYAALTHMEPATVAKEFSGENYSAFKKRLAEVIVDHFAGFRANKKKLLAKPSALASILKTGSKKAAAVAEKKMEEVKRKVGLGR